MSNHLVAWAYLMVLVGCVDETRSGIISQDIGDGMIALSIGDSSLRCILDRKEQREHTVRLGITADIKKVVVAGVGIEDSWRYFKVVSPRAEEFSMVERALCLDYLSGVSTRSEYTTQLAAVRALQRQILDSLAHSSARAPTPPRRPVSKTVITSRGFISLPATKDPSEGISLVAGSVPREAAEILLMPSSFAIAGADGSVGLYPLGARAYDAVDLCPADAGAAKWLGGWRSNYSATARIRPGYVYCLSLNRGRQYAKLAIESVTRRGVMRRVAYRTTLQRNGTNRF